MKYQNILEEAVKNKVTQDFFSKFDCTNILGKIDFAVKLKRSASAIDFADEYLLWAEAKQKPTDIIEMLAQLVLTIGKAKTFNEILPPPFLGCYDSEKIAFIPYSEIQDIFYQNDFNWKVTPSNTETKEFKQVYTQIKKIVENSVPWETYLFYFEKDEKELRKFIKDNFIVGKTETTKIRIDKNNFINVYQKWADTVQPTIQFNWDAAKKHNIISGDFFLADLLSEKDSTLLSKLDVVLRATRYEMNRYENVFGAFTSSSVDFKDNQKAYNLFWAKYERPPKEDYWDYIIERRELLVPQDVREIKGSFFTPPEWVELSQEYLAKVFGEDWQDEYYVWDCAAGTGNLLAGLVNRDRIFASTLDKQDVDVMKQRIENGANLWAEQVFQFDFLNDDFLPKSKGGKLPDELYNIISDEKKRKKLLIYINPPYVEAASARTIMGTGENRKGVALNKTKEKYLSMIGSATNELFALFLIRIYCEISGCKIGQFSTQKILNAPNFQKFREVFQAKLESCFVIPANTFDNVKGKFPIGFKIWDTNIKEHFESIKVDVYNHKRENIGKKLYFNGIGCKYINNWYKKYYDNKGVEMAIMNTRGNDVQNYNYIRISSDNNFNHTNLITIKNLIPSCVYLAVRKVIVPTWLNDRDQFLYPNNNWEKDIEFQNDCLTYALFNNNIQSKYGKNHWIPFCETELNTKQKFDSHFMYDFINGNLKKNGYSNLFEQEEEKMCIKREFSKEAQAVFDAGRELWKYYFKQKNIDKNASYYDIRTYFRKSNKKDIDENYLKFNVELTATLNILAKKIETKVYEYGFLKE